jgi:hypothetical protein
MKRTLTASLILSLALAILLPAFLAAAPQAAPAKTAAKAKVPAEPATIHPGFATLKDKTAVIVFLVWIWLIAGVLAYFLRLKIREADRVYHLKFYPAPKDAPRPPIQ